jgi:hypothetical protein
MVSQHHAAASRGKPGSDSCHGSNPTPCVIRTSDGKPIANNDPLARFLTASAACPANVFEFRSQLTAAGAKLRPTLVANRGFHNPRNNPKSVQMMLFEIVSGRLDALGIEIKDAEFFFGHFITTNGTSLKAGQGVFIELIAWDSTKEVFNFYELTEDDSGILFSLSALLLAVWLAPSSFAQNQQGQTTAQTPADPHFYSVTVTRVKPEMANEYQQF